MPFKNQRAHRALLASLCLLSVAQLQAGEIIKANNTNTLNAIGAWSGGVVPGANDIAVWNSATNVDRTNSLGDNVSFGGIKVTDVSGGTTQSINATTGAVLTLGSSGIDMSAATVNLSISAIMDLSASQTWNVASGRTLSVSGTNTGSGTISLTGGGTFGIGNNSALGTGAVNLGDGITLTNANTRTLTNAANLNGNISVSLTGTANTNQLALNGGLNVGSGNRTITLSNPNMVWSANDNATNYLFTMGGTGTQLTGTGSLTLANSGASPMVGVRFATTNYVQTDVTVGNGVAVSFSSANAFTANGGLTVNAGGRFSLSSGGSTVASQTVAYLSGAGTVTKDAAVSYPNGATLTIDGSVKNTNATFSGVIQDGTGTSAARLSITKEGSTKQVFSGSNTYTGQTLVNGGSLFVNGTHIESAAVTGAGYSGTTAGHYQIASGATLGGSGRIAGFNATINANMVLIQSGGFLAPGGDTALGTMVLDGGNISGTGARVLNMASGAKFNFTLAGSGGTSDKLAFWNFAAGDIVLNSNAIDLTLSGPQVAGTYTVSLMEFFSDAGASVVSSGLSSGMLTIGTLGAGIESASLAYNGSTIDLTYTVSAIPEPATFAVLLGALALGCAGLRRRCRCA